MNIASSPPETFFEAVGGAATFATLARTFYELVAEDPVLRPLYPDEDLEAAEHHLALFLMQYWGGPATYHDLRGHPRLRLRHAPFAIGPAERDAWLACMRVALDTLELTDAQDADLWDYLVRAAFALQNRHDSDPGSGTG
jgi:hemoglobin